MDDITSTEFRCGEIIGCNPKDIEDCFEYFRSLGCGVEQNSNNSVIITSVPEREVKE